MQDFLDMPGAADRTEYIFLNGFPAVFPEDGGCLAVHLFKIVFFHGRTQEIGVVFG